MRKKRDMTRGKTRSKSKDMLIHRRPLSQTSISQTLMSKIRAPKGSMLRSLKYFYALLLRLSNKSITGFDSKEFEVCENIMNGRESLGELLFKELESRFDMFFSALCGLSESSDALGCVDELALLLRCGLVLLTLVNDIDVVSEKTRILLRIFGKLVSFVHRRGNKKRLITLEKRVSHEFSYRGASCTASVSENYIASVSISEPSDQFSSSLCVLLEVFADELIVHRLPREYFMRFAKSCPSSSLLLCHFHNGGIGTVLEVLSLQFIVSFSDEERFENFLNRLSCRAGRDLRACEISLISSVSLLLNPTVLSAPKIFQAHLMLLVSEAIGISMSENVQSNTSLIGASYFTTFERSIILYNGLMSTLLPKGHPIGRKVSFSSRTMFERRFELSFECHIQEKTRAKLDDIVARSASSWILQSRKLYDVTRSDLLADSIKGIDKCQVDESCRNDILDMLNSIVLGAFADSVRDAALYKEDGTNLQDVYLLAAVLKLINSSMSKVICCLRPFSKDYDFIVNIIGCFQHFNAFLPNQKKLLYAMETNLTRHKTTKWMLLHISGLLSLSFASGFGFLVENCVSILVALMNLYVFEEGNVEELRSVLVPGSKSFSSNLTLDKPKEAKVDEKLCHRIASRFQKIRSEFLSSESRSLFRQQTSETLRRASIRKRRGDSIEVERIGTCNGKVFLDCLLKNARNLPDYDDLANFIECKAAKDYSSWLKDKERHRRWRSKKMAVLRGKIRKRT